MPTNIHNNAAELLARQIADKTGKSIQEAIHESLKERWERLTSRRLLRADLDEILRRVDALPVLDTRTPEEILGYDEHGLPRS